MAGNPQPQSGNVRHSHGLEQFFASLPGPGQRVLDLGEFTQANVTYITSLGHRLYTEDFLHTLDLIFGPGESLEAQADPQKAALFLDHVLQFPPGHFDAVLVWDTLEFLSKPLLDVVMQRLHLVLRSQSPLLACFHPESREATIPAYSFRIAGPSSLHMFSKGSRRAGHSFNNRAIEKLFTGFHSVKFFLTRDHLREVIVRR